MTIVNLRKIQVEFLSRDETRATHPSYPTQQPGVPYRNSEFIQSLTVQYTMATSCYSNAYEIYSAVAFNNVKNVTICPGTTFTVGAPADDEFTGFSGGFPILIDQPDVEVFCGFPSSSKNACVLDGGFHQLLVGNPASDTDNCDNLLVHGLTFTGTLENALGGFASAVYATAAASNVVLDDCIFKDTTYDGFAVMVESDSTVEITIQNTVFENIDYGYGMLFGNDMTMNLNDVTFDNVKHVPSAESNGAVYFSNIIWGPGPASAFVDVTIKNSNYYTAALATTWNSVDSFNVNIPSPDPLITLIDTDVLVDPNDSREPNISFCGGGWAADYNITDNTFECFRLTTNVDFFDFLDCGVNCNEWDEYTYFRDVLIATGLFDTLSEADYDEVTVFVPDNGAFDDIPDGYIEALIENDMDTLIEIVKYHITKDIVYTASIELGYGSSETILEGESVSYSLPVAPRNQFLVNGAAIIKADLEEKPGSGKLIQVIDKILIPPTVTLNPGIADILVDLSLNIVIVAAYAEYEPQLDPSKTYTLLAPSNAALDADSNMQSLLDNTVSETQIAANKEAIKAILNNHLVEGTFDKSALENQDCIILTSLDGKDVKVTFNSGDASPLFQDQYKLTSNFDLVAVDGIVHEIDGVLSIEENVSCPTTTAQSGAIERLSLPTLLLGAVVTLYTIVA